VKSMDLEEVSKLISESANRVVRAVSLSRRDEKWWAALAKEDWNLIKLSWELRGVILKRGEGAKTGSHLSDRLFNELEEILKESDSK